jgi:hypothetical protein
MAVIYDRVVVLPNEDSMIGILPTTEEEAFLAGAILPVFRIEPPLPGMQGRGIVLVEEFEGFNVSREDRVKFAIHTAKQLGNGDEPEVRRQTIFVRCEELPTRELVWRQIVR